MRCSEPGHRAPVAIHASRGAGSAGAPAPQVNGQLPGQGNDGLFFSWRCPRPAWFSFLPPLASSAAKKECEKGSSVPSFVVFKTYHFDRDHTFVSNPLTHRTNITTQITRNQTVLNAVNSPMPIAAIFKTTPSASLPAS